MRHHALTSTAYHQRMLHREQVAEAQASLQSFIKFLRQLPFKEGTYTLSMDLFAVFEYCCGIELPRGFQIEFGRQFNAACRDGRLPFKRRKVRRARLAAYDGLDFSMLEASLGIFECT